MIWSLIPNVEEQPPISLSIKSLFTHPSWKWSLWSVGGDTMPLLYRKIMRGYMFPKHLRVSWIKFIKLLDLTKMRTAWQKRSVGCSLIHLVRAVVHGHASTRATSLMRVKNSTHHLCLCALIFWDIGMKKIKKQKHQIE